MPAAKSPERSPSPLFMHRTTAKKISVCLLICAPLWLLWFLRSGWLLSAEPRDFNMAVPHLDVLTVDTETLQAFLEEGSLKSSHLVDLYLDQILRHDDYLHGMLTMPSREALQKIAVALDKERAAGRVRSKLHGIPVILKDNINTHPELGMKSTSGSLALEDARPRENARLVDKIIAAGMIILGKANLSELSNFRGERLPSGWSALGGQCQSPYVRGGVLANDSKDGHSSPSGSSSGSAVVVAAGYAPLSVGTETDGSLICPAGRASVYTIKPTIGLISQKGLIPVSHTMDSAGPMAKTPYDIAAFLDVLREEDAPGCPTGGYTSVLPGSMSDFSVAAVDYREWIFPPAYMAPDESTTAEMNRKFQDAYDTLKLKSRKFSENVPLIKPEAASIDGKSCKLMIMLTDFRKDFQAYLDDLEFAPVKTLQELIDFNREHADVELPPGHSNQKILEQAADLNLTEAQYQEYLNKIRKVSRDEGIDYILDKYDADVIIGPADSGLSTLASGSGYPIAGMPLGYLQINGRAFGLVALARKHQEATLIKFLSAWDATFHPRKPPPMLASKSAELDAH
ncbi:amidase signature domain-containing protein [Trichoderma sp. SZMC 28014]